MSDNKKGLIISVFILAILWFAVLQPKTNNSNNNKDKANNEQVEDPIIQGDKDSQRNSNMFTDDLSMLTLNGEPFKISNYNNYQIIVSFFSSTCPYCTQQTELFEKYREELDYEVFYVPYNEDFEKGKEHILSLDYNVDSERILEDPDSAFANQFKLQATPTNLFANQENTNVKGVVGLTSGETYGMTDKEFLNYLFDLLKDTQQ